MMQVAMKKQAQEARIRQCCGFRIFDRLYGLNIQEVKEICPVADFTPIFHAPKEIKGYVNIRGQIYLLLDLRPVLGFEAKEIDSASRVVLFRSEIEVSFAILVDSVEDIYSVQEQQIQNRRSRDERLSETAERRGIEIAEGVCKMESELLIILSSANLSDIARRLKPYAEK